MSFNLKRPIMWAGVSAFVAVGGLIAVLLMGGRSSAGAAPLAATPDAALNQWETHARDYAVGQVDGSYDPANSPGALAFRAGTTYDQAITRIYESQLTGAPLGAGVRLVAPLPAGKVLVSPTDGSGVIVDLAAPYGYYPQSGIAAPDAPLAWPSDYPGGLDAINEHIGTLKAQGGHWWAGASVADLQLPACEVMTALDAPVGATCGPQDYVQTGLHPERESTPLS